MFYRRRYGTHQAFTLNELLVVIAILGILAAISINTAQHALINTRLASVVWRAKSLSNQYIEFFLQTGIPPEQVTTIEEALRLGVTLQSIFDIHEGDRVVRHPNDSTEFFRYSLLPITPLSLFDDPFPNTTFGIDNFMAYEKQTLNSVHPFQGGEQTGCVLISAGPNEAIESNPNWNPQQLLYDSTNGLISAGDVLVSLPELSALRFQ